MAHFILLFQGGTPSDDLNEQESAQITEQWTAWFEELSDRIIDPGAPFSDGVAVSSSGEAVLGNERGYLIVEADSLDVAAEYAASSPMLAGGGTDASVQVFELVNLRIDGPPPGTGDPDPPW
jgi:hypothetical protein